MSQLPWLIETLKFIKEQEDEPLSIEICVQVFGGWRYCLITAPLEDLTYSYASAARLDQDEFNAEVAHTTRNLAVIVYYNEKPSWTHPNTVSKNFTGNYYQLILQSDRRSE